MTMNTQSPFVFDGYWHQIKGQLRQKFALLTDDDLEIQEGKGEELLGRLQTKLSMTKEAVHAMLNDLKQAATSAAGNVAAKVGNAANSACEEASHRMHTLQDQAADYVAKQPRKALITALAVGFIVGLLIRR